jgi:hypothetical protein
MTFLEKIAIAIEFARIEQPELIEHEVETPEGSIVFMAELRLVASTLLFTDVCIYPKNALTPSTIGSQSSALREQISLTLQAAKSLGYDAVELHGKRVSTSSSANIGKLVSIKRKVKP